MNFDRLLAFCSILIGIGVSFYFYVITRQKRELSVKTSNIKIIGRDDSLFPQELKVSFAGREITDLSKTNWIFWNSGNTPIRNNEAVEEYHVKISLDPGAKILRYLIVTETLDRNGVKITPAAEASNCFHVNFRFLEAAQGFNVEIMYTGDDLQPSFEHGFVGMAGQIREYDKVFRGVHAVNLMMNLLAIFGFLGVIYVAAFQREELQHINNALSNQDLIHASWSAGISLLTVCVAVLAGRYGGRFSRAIQRRVIGEPSRDPPKELLMRTDSEDAKRQLTSL